MIGMLRTRDELTCKYFGEAIICKRLGVIGEYGNCAKCGWNPEVAERRKEDARSGKMARQKAR